MVLFDPRFQMEFLFKLRTVARVRAVLFGDNSSPAEGVHRSSIVVQWKSDGRL